MSDRKATSRLPDVQTLTQQIPNMLTLGAICAGLTAIRFAMQGRYETATALILLAAFLDGIDGSIARLLKSESPLGAELDSLADFVNFGVAPGLFVYLWALQDAKSEGWIAVLIFAIGCVLRLARFNVDQKTPKDAHDPTHFVGVPAPMGALLALFPFALTQVIPGEGAPHVALISLWMVFVGFLFISRLPTPKLNAVRVATAKVRYLLIGVMALLATLFTFPWVVLALVDVGYLGLLGYLALQMRKMRVGQDED
ncbi:CDP-diacylglycerol--serine O-phosphatidyltransferase [Halovulum sp. GXIMD14793]